MIIETNTHFPQETFLPSLLDPYDGIGQVALILLSKVRFMFDLFSSRELKNEQNTASNHKTVHRSINRQRFQGGGCEAAILTAGGYLRSINRYTHTGTGTVQGTVTVTYPYGT